MVWERHHTSRKIIAVFAGCIGLGLCVGTAFTAGAIGANWNMDVGVHALIGLLWFAFAGMSLGLFELLAVLGTSPDATLDLLQITDGEIGPVALAFILGAALLVVLAAPFSADGRRGIVRWFGQALAGGVALAGVNVALAVAVVVSGVVGAGVGAVIGI